MAQNCRLYPSPGTDQQKTWHSNQTNNLKKCCSTVLYNLNCISILGKTIKHQQCLSFLLPQKWIKVPKCHLWIKSKNGYLGFLEITHLKKKKISFNNHIKTNVIAQCITIFSEHQKKKTTHSTQTINSIIPWKITHIQKKKKNTYKC